MGARLRWWGGARGPEAGLNLGPATTYEAVTRQMVETLTEDVREIKSRVNSLFWMMAGTVAVEIVFRLTGLGQ